MAKVISDFLDFSAGRFPQKTALIYNGRKYTYKKVQKRSEHIANKLLSLTKKGNVVAILLPNSPEFIFAYFGILKAGCIVLLLPSNISDDSLKFQISKTNPKIILSTEIYRSKFERTGILEKVNYININKIPLIDMKVSRNVSGDDISTIIFTSGTTSVPKGVKLQHKNVVNATKNIIEFLKFNENDIDVNISSLSHSFGLGHLHCLFAVSGTIILFRDAINLKKILKTIVANKATSFGAVPAIIKLILANFENDLKILGKYLRFIQTNTGVLEEDLILKVFDLLPNTDFNYYYGLTEASRSTFITLNKNRNKIKSVGRPSPNVKIKIISEDGKKLNTFEIGEICIKGKHVIKEYWKNKNASGKIKNGWFFTGDFGFLDGDGYLYFKGREDDIINVSGEKVAPEEIEEIAKKFNGIKDAAAIGIKDKLLGESVKLFIVPDNKGFDLQALINEFRKRVESYKIPKSFEIINQIPRTENGKISRNRLKTNQG